MSRDLAQEEESPPPHSRVKEDPEALTRSRTAGRIPANLLYPGKFVDSLFICFRVVLRPIAM